MLNAQRIHTLAENYSAQEFFAALIWQRRFNEFDGPTVAADLCKHSNLWSQGKRKKNRSKMCIVQS